MTDRDDGLQRDGFSIQRIRIGENYLPCPRCSHTRKKPKAPCVKLKVSHDDYVGKCYHCGETFNLKHDGSGRPAGRQMVSGKARHQPGDFGADARRKRYGVLP